MKAYLLTFVLCMMANSILFSQNMHDFTVTDAHGQVHNLYDDYLNKNKVVVIKFFFTTCPPCIANAPYWQQKYIDYGEGKQDVEFFSITTIPSDYNPEVIAFENQYHQTMKAISVDGGATALSNEFKSGIYGSWYGTPSFVVIAPDHSMQYPVFFQDLDKAIATARSKKITPLATTFIFDPDFHKATPSAASDIHFYLTPKNETSPKIEIKRNADQIYSFSYPSDQYPEMANPVVILEGTKNYIDYVSTLDVVLIQRHILGLETFKGSYQSIASDVNGDGRITASDLTVIRKLILGIINNFPAGVPSHKAIPELNELPLNPGNTVELKMEVVKMGNVN